MSDVVVIGSGPNGLVAANHLVDVGLDVVILEAQPSPGGSVRSAELTLPGVRHDVFSAFYPFGVTSPAFASLNLESYGLRWRRAPSVIAHPMLDGSCAEVSMDLGTTAASLESLHAGDGAAWAQMIDEWNAIADPLLEAIFRPFPALAPAAQLCTRLRPLGLARFARHVLLPSRRMAEERFLGEAARLLLGGCGLHTDLAPEAAGSGFYGWLLCCLAQTVGFPVPEGGAGALTDALIRRFEGKGGTLHCRARAVEVVVRRGRAVAVRTDGGAVFDARRAVVADVPATSLFGELVDASHLPPELLVDLSHFEWDMSTCKVDWALRERVPFVAEGARRAGTVHLADDFDNLTEYAAQIAMHQLPSRPFVVFGQQSIAESASASPLPETAWAYTHVPRRVRADASRAITQFDDERWVEPFVERMEARIEAVAPGFRSTILARHISGPSYLERHNSNLVGGAIGGGTSQLHQQLVLRPLPGMGRAETPVLGLYLASASAHPGGGVHGAAGANAARAVLAGFGRTRARMFGRRSRGSIQGRFH